MQILKNEWFDDDRFWTELAPLIMFGEGQAKKASLEARILASFFPEASHLLDLACGMGWHALELARCGFRVTAVDRTAIFLDQARQAARMEGLDIDFVQEDMRSFVRRESFDGVLNLSTSFGFFEDAGQDLQVLNNVHRSLRPSGLLILDLVGKEIFDRRFVEKNQHQVGNAVLFVERTVTGQGKWVEERWTCIQDEQRHEYRMNYRLYSASDLDALLEQAGFHPVEIWGDLIGTPYEEKASRLVALARKPASGL